MNANEYQELAKRTINGSLGIVDKQYHALFGVAGELGEIHSIHQKIYQGHPYDEKKEREEWGDLLWFVAEYCTAKGWKMGDLMQENIEKLVKRYPEGFDEERSVHR